MSGTTVSACTESPDKETPPCESWRGEGPVISQLNLLLTVATLLDPRVKKMNIEC